MLEIILKSDKVLAFLCTPELVGNGVETSPAQLAEIRRHKRLMMSTVAGTTSHGLADYGSAVSVVNKVVIVAKIWTSIRCCRVRRGLSPRTRVMCFQSLVLTAEQAQTGNDVHCSSLRY